MSARTITVASSGGSYTNLHAMFAAETCDTTVDNGSGGPGRLAVVCENFEDTTEVDITSAWTSNQQYPIQIIAASSHSGKWSENAYRLNVAGTIDDGVITLNRSTMQIYLELRGIQMRNSGTQNFTYGIRTQSVGASTLKLRKCLLIGDHSDPADTTLYGIYHNDGSINIIAENNVIYGWNRGLVLTLPSTGSYNLFYNNTIDDCHTGVYYAGSNDFTTEFINNRISNCTNPVVEASTGEVFLTSSDYNLTDGIASNITSWGASSLDQSDAPTISYVDSTSLRTARDYHLEASDSGIGAGMDLSSWATYSFTDDIDGETRG